MCRMDAATTQRDLKRLGPDATCLPIACQWFASPTCRHSDAWARAGIASTQILVRVRPVQSRSGLVHDSARELQLMKAPDKHRQWRRMPQRTLNFEGLETVLRSPFIAGIRAADHPPSKVTQGVFSGAFTPTCLRIRPIDSAASESPQPNMFSMHDACEQG